jgi:hypothetical protein
MKRDGKGIGKFHEEDFGRESTLDKNRKRR